MRWDEDGCLEIDLHVHTIASGHAFGTVAELAGAAERKGMTVLGISDHGPSMAGAPKIGYFTMAPDLARWPCTTKLAFGCEANIISLDGELDIDVETQRSLDYVMAGIHSRTPYDEFKNNQENNTAATMAALRLHRPAILTHPLNPRFPIKVDIVVRLAAELGVALEINARVLENATPELIDAHRRLLDVAVQEGARLVLGSDAHIPPLVGNVASLMCIREELIRTYDQIINASFDHFRAWCRSGGYSAFSRKET
jgi:putative hydrolase